QKNLEQIEAQAKLLEQQAEGVEVRLSISLEENAAKEAQTEIDKVKQSLDDLANYLAQGPINAEISQAFADIFGDAGPLVEEQFRGMVSNLLALGQTLFDNLIASYDLRIEEL